MVNKKNSIFNFFNHLDKNVKKKFFILLPLISIGAFFELFLLGLIPVFIDFILDNAQNSKAINFLNNLITSNFSSKFEINLKLLVIFLFFFSIFKFLYDSFLHIFQSEVVFDIKTVLQKNLLSRYLTNKIIFFKKKNTSILVRNLTTELGIILSRVLFPIMTLFVNILIVFIFSLFLFLYNYKVFLILILLLLILFITIKTLTYKKLKLESINQQFHDGLWIKNIQQIFGAIREIKIIQKINIFLNISLTHASSANKSHAKTVYLPLLTKNALELLAILLFIILITIMQKSSIPKVDVIKIVSIYGFALFRMLPMVNRIIIALQSLRAGKTNIENYIETVNETQFSEKQNDSHELKILKFKKINLRNIEISYDNKILDFKKFDINQGDFIGIKGETGSGKSTFLEILIGLNEPDKGKVFVDENNIQMIKNDWLNSISYVPQDIYLLDDTIENNIIFHRNNSTNIKKRLDFAMNLSEIKSFTDNLELGVKTLIGERGIRISGGQRQRIGIARALFDPRPLIIFDEATSSLDFKTEERIITNIMNISKEHTIIMVAHRETSLRYCSKIFNLRNCDFIKE